MTLPAHVCVTCEDDKDAIAQPELCEVEAAQDWKIIQDDIVERYRLGATG